MTSGIKYITEPRLQIRNFRKYEGVYKLVVERVKESYVNADYDDAVNLSKDRHGPKPGTCQRVRACKVCEI